MLICPNCGKKNEDGEILCSECGSKLKVTERLQKGFAPRRETAEPVKPAQPVKTAESVTQPAEAAREPAKPETKPAKTVTDPVGSKAENNSDYPGIKPATERSAVTQDRGNASAGNWNEVQFTPDVRKRPAPSKLGIVLCAIVALLFFMGAVKSLAFSAKHRLTDIKLTSSYSYDNFSYTLQDHPDVYSSDGEKKEYTSEMKLRNGDRIVTGKHINASLNLGVDRTLTMMSVTETVVHQDDDETRIDLNKGAMFFDIDTPYSGREKLELVSGSVVIPITEGAGYMYYNGTDDFRIWVMNGEVLVSVYDGSGNTTTETITPGESAFIDISDEGVGFTVEKVGVDSLPSAMIRELSVNNGLLNVISPEAEWDRDDILKLAEEYKSQDLMYNFGVMPYWILNDIGDD